LRPGATLNLPKQRMILGFDFTSEWATLIYVLGGALVVVAALEKVFGWFGRLRRRFRPAPPIPPVIVLGAPGYAYSTVTDPSERKLEQTRYLEKLTIGYLIENKEANITVTDVETGVRRKDTDLDQHFGAFKAPALAPLEKTPVQGFEVSHEFFDGLAEDDFQQVLRLWVRFTAPDRRRWEVTYDPVARDHSAVVVRNGH
jgi:hypothetical protein